jgi:hypothetical protein
MVDQLLNNPKGQGPYDDEKQDSHGFGEPDIGPGHDSTPSGDSSDPTGGSWTKPAKPHPIEDANGYPSASPKELENAENDNGPSRSGDGGNLSDLEGIGSGDGRWNPDGDKPRGAFRQARGGYQNLKKRISKNKWLFGFGLGLGGGFVVLMVVLLLLVGSYKAVDFAEHVAAYQFARTTTQMAEDSTNLTEEQTSIDSIPDNASGNAFWSALKNKYNATSDQAGNLWSKLDAYRPQKIINNFEGQNILNFNESTTGLGRNYVSGVTINDAKHGIYTEADLGTQDLATTLKNSLIPGYKFVHDVNVSRNFAPDFIQAMRANDVAPIVRGPTASAVRSRLDVGLTAWLTGRFIDKASPAADDEVQRESTAASEGEQLSFDFSSSPQTAQDPTSSGLSSAGQDVEQTQNADLASPGKLAAIDTNPNQAPTNIANKLSSDVSSTSVLGLQGTIGSILKFFNPVYKYAVPLCLIYDGSLTNSGPSMDEQSDQLERSALWVQSAAAQEKDGSNVNGEAVGATDWKLGDITQSIAEERASGIPVDTSDQTSTEASPTGQYTYSLADYLPGGLGSLASDVGSVCPYITNIWVGVGLGVGGVATTALIGIFSGGTGDIAEAGGESDLDTELGQQMSLFNASEYSADSAAGSDSMLSRMMARAQTTASYASKFSRSATKFAWSTAKSVALTGLLTLYAKQLVTAEMGGSHSPLAVGQPYDDASDDGTNIYANEINQKEFYGAPMTDANLGPDNSSNQEILAHQESKQSAFERYAAINNPNSLISHLGILADGDLNDSFFKAITHLGADFLNPLRSFSSILTPFIPKSLASTPVTSVNTYYGNVQFGWTVAEKQLLDSCPQGTHDPDLCSYQPLENEKILDDSGNEAAIASKYSDCFTKSIGDLESSGELQRSQDGDIIADASNAPNPGADLCAPDNLSFNSSDSLAFDNDPTSPHGQDMIFRYRVDMSYNNTMDQLTSEQTVTATDSTPSGGDGGSTVATGPVSSSGYVDPFRNVKNLGTSRVDEGVDFTGSGPVTALGNGTVLNTTNSGWPGGTFIVYQLSDGPAKGKYVYMGENCNNIQVHIGETVTTNTVLCDMVDAKPYIETGWADGSALGDAMAKSVYIELPSSASYSTAYGQNFRDLLTSVGNKVSSCYDFPGVKLSGSLPSGWPTWISNPATNSGSQSCG